MLKDYSQIKKHAAGSDCTTTPSAAADSDITGNQFVKWFLLIQVGTHLISGGSLLPKNIHHSQEGQQLSL